MLTEKLRFDIFKMGSRCNGPLWTILLAVLMNDASAKVDQYSILDTKENGLWKMYKTLIHDIAKNPAIKDKRKPPGQYHAGAVKHDYFDQCYNGFDMSRCFYRFHHNLLTCTAMIRQMPGYTACALGDDGQIAESTQKWLNISRQYHEAFLNCLSPKNQNASWIRMNLSGTDMAAAAVCASWHGQELQWCMDFAMKCKDTHRCWHSKEITDLRNLYRRVSDQLVSGIMFCMNQAVPVFSNGTIYQLPCGQ